MTEIKKSNSVISKETSNDKFSIPSAIKKQQSSATNIITAEGSFLITRGKLFRSIFTYVHIYNNI